MCGGISRAGTSIGVLRSVGSSTVNAGMMRIRFEAWGLKKDT
jgi:hypothetical protein